MHVQADSSWGGSGGAAGHDDHASGGGSGVGGEGDRQRGDIVGDGDGAASKPGRSGLDRPKPKRRYMKVR